MKKVLICLTILIPTLIVAVALLWSMGVFARTLPVERFEAYLTVRAPADDLIGEVLKVQAKPQ